MAGITYWIPVPAKDPVIVTFFVFFLLINIALLVVVIEVIKR